MDALVLDQTYETLFIVDTFESFIWVTRYVGYGDFELYMPMSAVLMAPIQQDDYIALRDSDDFMIVEQLEIVTDVEKGTYVTITGRSLESILERRIVWGQKILTGNFQDAILLILNENIISPINPLRKIPNFTFKRSTDPVITSLTIDIQLMGDNLYDAIFVLCNNNNLGFRVLPDDSGGFIFELYNGADRSYAQDILPHVVFSPGFENLLGSNFLETKKALRTAALVAGEGEGADRKMAEATSPDGGGAGLARREMFVEATGVSSSTDDGELTSEEYKAQLIAKGESTLAEAKEIKSFEGEIDATRQFVYGKDFFIGDIVQIVNEYDMEATSRITELIRTHDAGGESFIPTFTAVESD